MSFTRYTIPSLPRMGVRIPPKIRTAKADVECRPIKRLISTHMAGFSNSFSPFTGNSPSPPALPATTPPVSNPFHEVAWFLGLYEMENMVDELPEEGVDMFHLGDPIPLHNSDEATESDHEDKSTITACDPEDKSDISESDEIDELEFSEYDPEEQSEISESDEEYEVNDILGKRRVAGQINPNPTPPFFFSWNTPLLHLDTFH
ncbi:hypothetical protein DFH28DRAFT_217959 [Melampsora americana]|nr:hypothetical protein DFH28DRAFT_217959 [Melampsora americana]